MGRFITKNEDNLYDLSRDLRDWQKDWYDYDEWLKEEDKNGFVTTKPKSIDELIKEVLSKKYIVAKIDELELKTDETKLETEVNPEKYGFVLNKDYGDLKVYGIVMGNTTVELERYNNIFTLIYYDYSFCKKGLCLANRYTCNTIKEFEFLIHNTRWGDITKY